MIPRGQGGWGSLSLHIGEAAQARELARKNLAAFPADVDAVITNAAGCGSGMHEYGLLFAGAAEAEAAGCMHSATSYRRFSSTSEVELPPRTQRAQRKGGRVGQPGKNGQAVKPTKLALPLCVALRSLRPTSVFGFSDPRDG